MLGDFNPHPPKRSLTAGLVALCALFFVVGTWAGCAGETDQEPLYWKGLEAEEGEDDGPPNCCECECDQCSETVTCSPDCGTCFETCWDACEVCGGYESSQEC